MNSKKSNFIHTSIEDLLQNSHESNNKNQFGYNFIQYVHRSLDNSVQNLFPMFNMKYTDRHNVYCKLNLKRNNYIKIIACELLLAIFK